MARLKHTVTVVEVGKSEEKVQDLLRNPLIDVNKMGAVRALIDNLEKDQTIFNLDPEPEKPLPIKLNLDQLEHFEE